MFYTFNIEVKLVIWNPNQAKIVQKWPNFSQNWIPEGWQWIPEGWKHLNDLFKKYWITISNYVSIYTICTLKHWLLSSCESI